MRRKQYDLRTKDADPLNCLNLHARFFPARRQIYDDNAMLLRSSSLKSRAYNMKLSRFYARQKSRCPDATIVLSLSSITSTLVLIVTAYRLDSINLSFSFFPVNIFFHNMIISQSSPKKINQQFRFHT